MTAYDAHPEPLRMEDAWERLLSLENQVWELRRLLLADEASADGPVHRRPTVALHAQIPGTSARVGASASVRGAHWQVVCLGTFKVRCAGRELPTCSSRRGWGILQYLLIRPGHAATRDALIEAFWPESAPAAGAHNLQMAVHALRRTLRGYGPNGSDEVVIYRDGQYALHPALTIDLDVHRFRAACERGRTLVAAGQHALAHRTFEAALQIYGGPFLHESGHDDWAEPHRATLQDLRLGVLGWLSNAYAAQSDWEQAAACCREILAADPYREDAVRQLLRCLAATGRPAEVERTYRACRERIWRDLQVEPALETVNLYHQLTRPETTRGIPATATGDRRPAHIGRR